MRKEESVGDKSFIHQHFCKTSPCHTSECSSLATLPGAAVCGFHVNRRPCPQDWFQCRSPLSALLKPVPRTGHCTADTVALHITAGQTNLQHASVEPISADTVRRPTPFPVVLQPDANSASSCAQGGLCTASRSFARCWTAKRESRTACSRPTSSLSLTPTRRAPIYSSLRRITVWLHSDRSDPAMNLQVLSVLWTRGSVEIERMSVRKGWAKPKCAAAATGSPIGGDRRREVAAAAHAYSRGVAGTAGLSIRSWSSASSSTSASEWYPLPAHSHSLRPRRR